MSKVFKGHLSNLAESFLAKLTDTSKKCNLESVFRYYSNLVIPEVFHIKSTSEEKLSKIIQKIEI